jgi:bifunctional UDP-N-acetylglucosamine pyrophosphorylase/glucosamine-1-phosphate N-acetyltransferase
MLNVVILAAGEGKRMRSARPKVLQPLAGRPMLCHLMDTVASLAPARVDVVVGVGADQVAHALSGYVAQFPVQQERLGTGHAAQQALASADVDDDSRVLILPGDMPLVRAESLRALLNSEADLALLSFLAEDPTGYGRVVRDAQGVVVGIREQRDASADELAIQEVNSGVMCASAGAFRRWLAAINADNAQGEYYLTDCIALAATEGSRVEAVPVTDAGGDGDELMGANDRAQLAVLEQTYQQRARQALMAEGAQLLDPDTVYIRGTVTVGQDVCIDAGVVFEGDVRLGDGVSIATGCVLSDSDLAAGTRVQPYCVLEGVRTTGACQIGPFARLRPGTALEEGVRIGNFVETKNSHFAAGAKANHLSYVGDAQVGAAANIGAGTITCNYDGANKHLTDIGAGAFIGSNSALVAPVKIGAGATIGAGSTISKDAPEQALTLTRAPQKTIEGWQRPRKRTP